MATIIEEGCITKCGYCNTKFSFTPSEVHHATTPIPAGYSPEEEAYDKSHFTITCPKCKHSVNVEDKLGSQAKTEIRNRPKHSEEQDL